MLRLTLVRAPIPGKDKGGGDEAVRVHDVAGYRPVVRQALLHAGDVRSQAWKILEIACSSIDEENSTFYLTITENLNDCHYQLCKIYIFLFDFACFFYIYFLYWCVVEESSVMN